MALADGIVRREGPATVAKGGADVRILVGRALLTAMIAGSAAIGAAHVGAPIASAECDGGLVFAATAPHARAALVGRVEAFTVDEYGFRTVTRVRVERAFGIAPGAEHRGRVTTGWCADDIRTGSRVVLLLGVNLPGTLLDGDCYYLVGESLTSAEAATVGRVLLDTATAAPGSGESELEMWPLALAGGAAFGLALRRIRRGGAPPPTPRPRTRGAPGPSEPGSPAGRPRAGPARPRGGLG